MGEAAKKLIKMSELSKRSKVSPGAIKFYLKEGLLPRPHKTSRNMAYYDPSCIERLRLIKELQTKRFLPLQVIKTILDTSDRTPSVSEIKTLMEIEGEIFKALDHQPDFKPVAKKELLRREIITKAELKKLEELDILHPQKNGKEHFYSEDDVHLIETMTKMRESGFSRELGFDVAEAGWFKELVELLVKEEIDQLSKRVVGKVPPDKIISLVLSGYQHVNTLFGIMHKKMILSEIQKIKEASDGDTEGAK